MIFLRSAGPYATQSRQPRQVRKEATATGSCVRSRLPGTLKFPSPPHFSDSIFVGPCGVINGTRAFPRYLDVRIKSKAESQSERLSLTLLRSESIWKPTKPRN